MVQQIHKEVDAALTYSKKERLLKNQDFIKVQKLGQKFYTKHFIIVALQRSENTKEANSKRAASLNLESSARLGITITNKTEPSSVKRNRVKRIVREAFRKIKKTLKPYLSLVVIAKHGACELNSTEVQRQLAAALKFHGYTLR